MTARRYLCLWLPSLATDRLWLEGLLDEQVTKDSPASTARRVSNTAYIEALNASARRMGLRPGMTIAGARAIQPSLAVVDHDPAADRAFLEELALWADRFSPLVALDGPSEAPDALMLDIGGCAHLFGGEVALMAEARAGLAAKGIAARAALAATSGAATALARFGDRAEILIEPETRLSEALGPLPVAALRAVSPEVGPEAMDGLARVGLRRIADLLPMPRAALAARFGLALAGALDRALGQAARPIDSRPPKAPYRVWLRFPDPIGAPEDIAAALDRLLVRLCARLAAEDRGARRLDWLLIRADGSEQRLSIGVARPARDAARLTRLFEEKLKTVDTGYGIDFMLLSAPVIEAFDVDQNDLSLGEGAIDTPAESGALTTVIDRLTNRLGGENVFRLAPVDSHLPDRAQDRAPAISKSKCAPAWPKTGDRPTRLLHTPHPIEPLTAAKGLGAPTAFRVFGRRALMRVIRGPERIAPEWWRPDAVWRTGPRDYFDVEDSEGRRFWIYRDAATGPRRDHRWYLHGLF